MWCLGPFAVSHFVVELVLKVLDLAVCLSADH